MKLKQGQKIEVKWIDTVTDDTGWVVEKEYPFDMLYKAAIMNTVGFFFKQAHGMIHLAMNKRELNDKFSVVTAIPLGCVKSIKKL